MSFKKFSVAQDAQGKEGKDKTDDTVKAAPANDQPARQPDGKPAEAAPARKS